MFWLEPSRGRGATPGSGRASLAEPPGQSDARRVSSAAFSTQRPVQVPEQAQLELATGQWVWCERDEAGEQQGSLRVFRADGAPLLELEYVHGKRHGAYRRFHASGALAEIGRYFDDLRDGLLTSFADGDSTDSIRECCIPEATRVLKQEYRRGTLLVERFYGADGEELFEPESASGAWPEPLRERAEDVLLTPYAFWPELEPLTAVAAAPGDDARVEQPLAELKDAIGRAAERVARYREELLARAPELAPPDVAALIGSAPALRRFSLLPPGEQESVHVDELPPWPSPDPKQLALEARVAWSGLCWLCWASGLDRLGVPERLCSRPELHAALWTVSERSEALRHHDSVLDDARHFHGLDERVLPAAALVHLARHYEEARAMLLFVSDGSCASPWQDDLGRAR